jgi:membrane-associated phospholipid phosphatase
MKRNLLLLFFLFNFYYSLSYAQPSAGDYWFGYGGNVLVVGSELFLKDALTPEKPQWSEPNAFDQFFRNKLIWDDMEKAALISDILLRAITVPSIFWSSYKSGYKYSDYVLLQMEVTGAIGLLTQLSKFIAIRQRPYSYFKTRPTDYPDEYLSFFSGHSSFSFAIATSTGYLLERSHPGYSGLIWSSCLSVASTTAILRIAADRHYMTDVLTGTVIGALTGYLIAKNQRSKFFNTGKNTDPDFRISFTLPINTN